MLPAGRIDPLLGRRAVTKALIVEYYAELPGPLAERRKGKSRSPRTDAALSKFKELVGARYNEGTLQRLLAASAVETRRASVLALGMLGTMASNQALAAKLRDPDSLVRRLATDALWSLWFRADNGQSQEELQKLTDLEDVDEAIRGLNRLIQRRPNYAEAYNQRAILYLRQARYQECVADCERVLKMNAFHYGAMAGMGQAYIKLLKPRAALRAFRNAFRVNPALEGIEEAIQFLEDALDEEGKKDDKK
jgi:tetratricopeptide (TPR) repeat protein